MKSGASVNPDPNNPNTQQEIAENDISEAKSTTVPSPTPTLTKIQAIENLFQRAINTSNTTILFLALQALFKASNSPESILKKALYWCVCKGSNEEGNEDVFDILIRQKAPVNGSAEFPSLYEAIKRADLKMVQKLVKAGAFLDNVHTPDGFITALQLALIAKNTEIFDFLLDAGADPNFCTRQMNLSDLVHNMKDAPLDLIQHVENKIGLSQENLEIISKNFENILQREFLLATSQGKKPLILLGESHANFKIMQIEKCLLPIAKKFGINTLFLEYPHHMINSIYAGQINSEKRSQRSLYVFAQDTLKLQLKGVDNHPLRSDELSLVERNHVIVDTINSENQAGIFITGSSHLLGLLTDPVKRINLKSFHVVPFNLSGLIKQTEDNHTQIFNILNNYYQPQNDDTGKFKSNPSYVIQLSQNLSFSPSEVVSSFWNVTQKLDNKIVVDLPKQLTDQDLEKLKESPVHVVAFAQLNKSLNLINLSQKIGADLPAHLLCDVVQNNIEDVLLLYLSGVDINAIYNNKTLLHVAVICGHLEMVKLLLFLGVDINITDKYGTTAAELATSLNFHEINKIIVSSAASQNSGNNKTIALKFAARGGYLDIVKNVLSASGNDISLEDKRSALEAAAQNGHFSIVEHFLQIAIQKSEIDTLSLALEVLTKTSSSPRKILRKALYLSVFMGSDHKEYDVIIDILIKHGAPVNGSAEFPSLYEAIRKADLKMVEKLVAKGADLHIVHTPDGFIITALQLAVIHQNTEIFDFLLAAGANPDLSSKRMNLSDFSHLIRDEKNIPAELITYVEEKIGFSQEHLEKIAKNFEDILQKESLKAILQGKKLLILLGENHFSFKIKQIESRLLPIVKKLGISILFLELPHDAVDFMMSEKCDKRSLRNLLGFAQKTLKLQLKAVDNHPLRSSDRLEELLPERNRVIVDNINSVNQAGLFITGSNHLLGLLADPLKKINLKSFHVVPFNLSSLVKDPLPEQDKILCNYLRPQNDDLDKFKNNPKYVIQILEDLTFSSPEKVSDFWNCTQNPAKQIVIDVPNQLKVNDLTKLKENPNYVLSFALREKSLDLINLSLKIGAAVQEYLFDAVAENNIDNVLLLYVAGIDISASYDNSSALHEAVHSGDLVMVSLLIKLGADLTIRNEKGKTAAELAKALDLNEIYECISSAEKTKNSLNPKKVAFRFAALSGRLNFVKFILIQSANEISSKDKGWALRNCAREGRFSLVDYLLTIAGNDIETKYKVGALQAAAKKGHLDITKMLLNKCPTLREVPLGKQLWERFQLEKDLVLTLAHYQKNSFGVYLPHNPGRILTHAFKALKEQVPQTPAVKNDVSKMYLRK